MLLAFVYAFICIFDFVAVPMWLELNRPDTADIDERIREVHLNGMSEAIAREVIKPLTYQHEPFTLKGGGLFHLAFGALLTGSAMSRGKRD